MRSKIVLVSAIVVALAFGANANTASAWSVSVNATYDYAGQCVPAPSQLSYRLTFSAKVKASGVAKPKKVRIGFQVIDATTKKVLRSGVTYLYRSKGFKGAKTPRFTVNGGQIVKYNLNLTYSVDGRKGKSKASFVDPIPSADIINNSTLPAC